MPGSPFATFDSTLHTHKELISGYVADDRWIPYLAASCRASWKAWGVPGVLYSGTFLPDDALPRDNRRPMVGLYSGPFGPRLYSSVVCTTNDHTCAFPARTAMRLLRTLSSDASFATGGTGSFQRVVPTSYLQRYHSSLLPVQRRRRLSLMQEKLRSRGTTQRIPRHFQITSGLSPEQRMGHLLLRIILR